MKLSFIKLFTIVSTLCLANSQEETDDKKDQCASIENLFADHINGPKCLCENKNVVPILNNYFVNHFPQCFNSTSLYFSQIDAVCSPTCFLPTVAASSYIQQWCPQSQDERSYGKIPSKNLVYKSWSNMMNSRLACTKTDGDLYCLDRLYRAQVHFTASSVGASVDNHKDVICHPCNIQFVKQLSDPTLVPTIYVHQLLDPKGLFEFIKTQCSV